jgi:OOP family OmpA-OmpF porin
MYVILALFVIGLGLGIAGGGWYLKKGAEEVDSLKAPNVIDEIFLMSESGKLIKHYTRRLKPDVDQDILSGMLVAVQGFVKDTFKGEEGQLEEMAFGEFKILIVRGKFSLIAAVVKGPDPKRFKAQLLKCVTELERKEKKTLKDWDGDSLKTQNIDPYMKGLIAGKYRRD